MTRHRGRGIASVNYPIGMNLGGDPSQALVHSNPSGKFTVAGRSRRSTASRTAPICIRCSAPSPRISPRSAATARRAC